MLNLLGINSVIRCWNVKPWHLPYVYLLRFANSWQGHCNSMSRQLLWAHNSSSPHKRWTTTQRTMSPTLNIQCVGSLTSHLCGQELWKTAYYLSSLSKKTSKHNGLQMSLQRQHFLLSYFKNLSVSLAGFEPEASCSVDQCLSNWSNWIATSSGCSMDKGIH